MYLFIHILIDLSAVDGSGVIIRREERGLGILEECLQSGLKEEKPQI